MKVVYTDAHLLHDPHAEMEASSIHAPYEHIGRALAIRDALAADPAFTLVAPSSWGTAPIEAVHDRRPRCVPVDRLGRVPGRGARLAVRCSPRSSIDPGSAGG